MAAFAIPDDIQDAVFEEFDAMLDAKGKNCKLFYPSIQESCVNCFAGSGANYYRSGGPAPFSVGFCPLCGGAGFRESENSDIVIMTIDWNQNPYRQDLVRIPNATLATRAYLTELPKLKQCVNMQIYDDSLKMYWNYKFKLSAEPTDKFIFAAGRYCIGYWERIL